MVSFSAKWLYSGKSGCIQAKVVVFRQKWLYRGQSDCHSGKSGYPYSWAKWLYSPKVVLVSLGKSGCIRAEKWLVFGINWLKISTNVICIRAKVVVFGQK